MLLNCHKILILLICYLNVLQVFCVRHNPYHRLGDQCELDNNRSGICKESYNCEYASKLINSGRIYEVSRCKFTQRKAIVCCPQKELLTTTKSSLTKTPTTQASKTLAPKYPKSYKLDGALCKDKITTTPRPQWFNSKNLKIFQYSTF